MTRIEPIVWFLLSIPWIIVACALPMHKMQDAFKQSLENTVGRTLESLKYEQGRRFIDERDPSEVQYLNNGNILHVYRDYWGYSRHLGMDREGCTVFLEFDSDTMTVVEGIC